MAEKKVIVERMVENGYHLMGHTVEWYAETFSLEQLERFEKKFLESKED